MDGAGPRNYRFLAEMLISGLVAGPDPEASAVEIGYRWGSREVEASGAATTASTPTASLTGLLDRLGFAPDSPAEGLIDLRHCPFLDVVEPYGGIVCAVHLGFLRGAAERLTPPVSVDRLVPFAEPDSCQVAVTAPA